MKTAKKVLLITALLSYSAAQADNPVTRVIEDTTETTVWYTEQAFRLFCLKYVGEAVRKGIPMTKAVEDLFGFVDKLPKVKELGLREKLNPIVWGALGYSAIKMLLKERHIRSITSKNAPSLMSIVDRLLSFKTEKEV